MIHGDVTPPFQPVADLLTDASAADPEHSFQLTIFRGAERVVDLHAGDGITAESLMVPFSVSKNSIAFSIALLVDRGELELDERVARYWPEFAAEGKHDVLVRELLSHQAGLVEARPRLTEAEYADPPTAAARLAAMLPWWRPGATFGYHGLTIGVLGAELVRRVTGQPFREFFESEFRAPRGIDFHVGTTPQLEERVVELLPMVAQAATSGAVPFVRTPGQIGREVFAGASAPQTAASQ